MVTFAAAVEVGDAWENPPADLGPPTGRIASGDRILFRWPELEVTVAAGRVVNVRRLDAASLAAEREARVRQAALERERWLAERRAAASRTAERAAEAPGDRPAQTEPAAPVVVVAYSEGDLPEPPAPPELPVASVGEAVALETLSPGGFDVAGGSPSEPGTSPDSAASDHAPVVPPPTMPPTVAAETEPVGLVVDEAPAEPETTHPTEEPAPTGDAARASAPQRSKGLLVKSPTDPIGKLEREIQFLRLDRARPDVADDRTRQRQLDALLRVKEAELKKLREEAASAGADSLP